MLSALASCARGLGVQSPRGGEENLLVRTRFPSCHLQEWHDTAPRPSVRDANWRPGVQGQSPCAG